MTITRKDVTFLGIGVGKVYPWPNNPPRKRYCAVLPDGRTKMFPTRRAATDWIHVIEEAERGNRQAILDTSN